MGKSVLGRWIEYEEIPETRGVAVLGESPYGILVTDKPEECVFFGETHDSYIGYFSRQHLNFRIVRFLKSNVSLF